MYLLIFYFLIVLGIVFAIVVFGFLFRDKLRDLMANPEATIKKTAKQILTKTSTAESVKKKRGPNKQCPECKRSRGHKPSCSQAQAKKVEI